MAIQVVACCHCRGFGLLLDLANDIPHQAEPCHCNICRRVTGAPYCSSLPLRSPPEEAIEAAKLSKFDTSSRISRYFCSVCGSHVLFHDKDSPQPGWHVCTGIVDGIIDLIGTLLPFARLEKFVGHEFVADTADGGMAVVMGGMKGEEGAQYYLRYHDHGEEIYDLDKFISKQQATLAIKNKEESLKGGCQCGGVQFTLLRPKESKGKHEACLCMCRSCRLSFGQPLTAWAMRIPFDRVYTEEGSVHDGSLFGTLCRYQSSELATRDFCGRCGASVFFHTTNRPGKVDIAFGLLQAPEGMRGASWFEWDNDGVHFPEDAVDKALLEMVSANYYSLKAPGL